MEPDPTTSTSTHYVHFPSWFAPRLLIIPYLCQHNGAGTVDHYLQSSSIPRKLCASGNPILLKIKTCPAVVPPPANFYMHVRIHMHV